MVRRATFHMRPTMQAIKAHLRLPAHWHLSHTHRKPRWQPSSTIIGTSVSPALGYLRTARCIQSRPELDFTDLYGTEPGAYNGHDRALPDRPGLEELHVQSGDRTDAGKA